LDSPVVLVLENNEIERSVGIAVHGLGECERKGRLGARARGRLELELLSTAQQVANASGRSLVVIHALDQH